MRRDSGVHVWLGGRLSPLVPIMTTTTLGCSEAGISPFCKRHSSCSALSPATALAAQPSSLRQVAWWKAPPHIPNRMCQAEYDVTRGPNLDEVSCRMLSRCMSRPAVYCRHTRKWRLVCGGMQYLQCPGRGSCRACSQSTLPTPSSRPGRAPTLTPERSPWQQPLMRSAT